MLYYFTYQIFPYLIIKITKARVQSGLNNNSLQVSGIIYMMIQHAQSNRGAPHSKLGSPNCKCHPLRIVAMGMCMCVYMCVFRELLTSLIHRSEHLRQTYLIPC